MSAVAGSLDALRGELPDCTLVAYGDLDTRLVLASSAADMPPREVLDALCLSADTCLGGKAAQAAARYLGVSRLTEATALQGGCLSLFQRGEGDGGDALFCRFDGVGDLDAARSGSRAALSRLERMS